MDSLKKLLAGLSVPQRISIAAAALIAAVGIFALLHFRREGDFRPLYSGMAPEDAAQVVQKLKEAAVEYRLADNGASVLVPSARLAESRLSLASAGLPKSGRIGFELFDKTNFGATELVEHINYQRALEGELERSIMSMAGVVQARVHLTFAKESVFLDQQKPAKGSVMVKLRPGVRLAAQNVSAIANLIASAVEGLTPEAVAILDMEGNLLSRPRRSNAADSLASSETLEMRQGIERDLVTKINATLEPLLGAEGFRAGASIDWDMTSGEQQEETFNPDQSVMVSSQKSEDSNEKNLTAGIPGTASNLPNPPARSGGTNGSSHRTENITYQTSRVVKHIHIPQGVIRRMSLSVLVGQPAHWEGSGKTRHRVVVPPSAETMKTIHDLVAGATGFNTDRGDQLIVETLPFESNGTPELNSADVAPAPNPNAGAPWQQFLMKYRNALLIAGGLVVVFSILLGVVFKFTRRSAKVKADVMAQLSMVDAQDPSPSALGNGSHAALSMTGSRRALTDTDEQTIDRIRTLAQQEPAAAAKVLRMWVQGQQV